MTANRKNTPSDLDQHAPEGMNLTEAEEKEARKEGAKEDVKEAAKDAHRYLTDGQLPGEPKVNPFQGHDESQQYAYLLDYGVAQFERLVAGKEDFKPSDVQLAGLLNLERNGQNRTPYVRALMKKLGLKTDDLPEIAPGGPSYTNDLTAISDL